MVGHRQHAKLLTLPVEIRAMILRELLWDPEPLFWYPRESCGLWWERAEGERSWFPSARTLHPVILRVCSQLSEEGHAILYDNSVRCVIGLDQPEPKTRDYCPAFVRRGKRYEILRISDPTAADKYEPLPQGLRRSMHKLDVQIVVPKSSFKTSRPDHIPEWLTGSVNAVKLFLQAHNSYQHLSFKLHLPADTGERLEWEQTQLSEFRNTVRRRLFTPLCMLRNRSSVKFEGIYPDTAQQMKVMLTNEPVVDLEAMGELVRETPLSLYAIAHYSGVECSRYVEEINSQCSSAAREGRVDEFIAARTKLMTLIALMSANGIRHIQRLDSQTQRELPKWKYITLGESLEDVAAILDDAPQCILDIAARCARSSPAEEPEKPAGRAKGKDGDSAFFDL